jgi:hypothetical protein
MSRNLKLEIKKEWGGKRQGSGRRKTGRQTVTLRMSPDLHADLKIEAKRMKMTVSEFVSKALRASPMLHYGDRVTYNWDSVISEKMQEILQLQTQATVVLRGVMKRHDAARSDG